MSDKNILESIAAMAKDDNKGVIMSKTVANVKQDPRGYIVGFGVSMKECADAAKLQELGLPNDYICVAFFIDRKELEKYNH